MAAEGVAPFDRVEGQTSAVSLLTAAFKAGRVPHACLFTGPAGTGRRTAARAWAQVLLCPQRPGPERACGTCGSCRRVWTGGHSDLVWVDFAWQAALLKEPVEKQKSLKIDTVRALEHVLRLKPSMGHARVAVLCPAEALGLDAGHALLKIIEEPPPGAYIALIAQSAGALLATLRSRCQRVRFGPLPLDVATRLLAKTNGHRPLADIERAVQSADGSIERAQSLLDNSDGLDFDWANCPLSELIEWCDGFQNPRLGRTAAERLLESLMARCQSDVRAGARPAGEGPADNQSVDDLARTAAALARLRANAGVSLTLLHLMFHLRRNRRRRAEVR